MSRKNTFQKPDLIVVRMICGIIPALMVACNVELAENVELNDVQTDVALTLLSTKNSVSTEEDVGLLHSDIFIFNNDELARLDAFQRVEGATSFKTASRSGAKILVAIANSAKERDDWRLISSYSGLLEQHALLQDEDPDYPILSGEGEIYAGAETSYEISMTRIMSKVVVQSLCADFYGSEYEGEPLEDVRIYLTNVNASCAYMKTEDFRPEFLINQGRYDEISISDFAHPEMVYCEFDGVIDSGVTYPELAFYCYPNDIEEESYGSPFTRLVIEGAIRGQTCYYPITINREENGVCFGADGSGIGRNCTYSMDITLTRFGTDDPDTPVSKGQAQIVCSVQDWTDMDEQTINF